MVTPQGEQTEGWSRIGSGGEYTPVVIHSETACWWSRAQRRATVANYRVQNPPLEVMIVRGSEDAVSWLDVIISQGDFHNGGDGWGGGGEAAETGECWARRV